MDVDKAEIGSRPPRERAGRHTAPCEAEGRRRRASRGALWAAGALLCGAGLLHGAQAAAVEVKNDCAAVGPVTVTSAFGATRSGGNELFVNGLCCGSFAVKVTPMMAGKIYVGAKQDSANVNCADASASCSALKSADGAVGVAATLTLSYDDFGLGCPSASPSDIVLHIWQEGGVDDCEVTLQVDQKAPDAPSDLTVTATPADKKIEIKVSDGEANVDHYNFYCNAAPATAVDRTDPTCDSASSAKILPPPQQGPGGAGGTSGAGGAGGAGVGGASASSSGSGSSSSSSSGSSSSTSGSGAESSGSGSGGTCSFTNGFTPGEKPDAKYYCGNSTTGHASGIENGASVTILFTAVDEYGNESVLLQPSDSDCLVATPVDVTTFWDEYGGEGGCGFCSFGASSRGSFAGLAASALSALGLVVRRRQRRRAAAAISDRSAR